jgi:Ca2+-binding RTX toxin-like protein
MAFILGTPGNDILTGGSEDDFIIGREGNDNLNGGSGVDELSGRAGNDNLKGGSGNDNLSGGAGNDILNGGSGNDDLNGGSGNDLYIVDSVNNVVIENTNEGNDGVRASVDYTLSNHVERLNLTGSATTGTGNTLNNTIRGNQTDNVLVGEGGRDYLYGGQGNDELIGGAGNDNLTGGAGSDTFVFAELGADIITDFNSADGDQIELDSSFFSNVTDISTEFGTVTSNADVDTSSELIVYNTTSGQLFYNQNNTDDGFGTGGLFATLSGAPALTAADFTVA